MMLKRVKKMIIWGVIGSTIFLTGCSTNRVIGESTKELFTGYENQRHEWVNYLTDEVVAVGKSTKPIPNEPAETIVVAGKKYSYVINKGGTDFFNLITQLNPEYIKISQELSFISPANDSNQFHGSFQFSYIKPNGELNLQELGLFEKYGVKPCKCDFIPYDSKKHTFEIEIAGKIYPVVENISSLKPLTKPYSIHLKVLELKGGKRKLSTKEKLQAIPMLPISLTIDLLVLPSKILGITYQP